MELIKRIISEKLAQIIPDIKIEDISVVTSVNEHTFLITVNRVEFEDDLVMADVVKSDEYCELKIYHYETTIK